MSTEPAMPMREKFSHLRKRVAALQTELAEIQHEVERLLVFDEAVSMAHRERTGEELQPGDSYTAKDAERAEEIMSLFPWE
jgi:hypothetical protein